MRPNYCGIKDKKQKAPNSEIKKSRLMNAGNHLFLWWQTHYASEDDPSFLLEDEDLEDDDEDDDEVTGYVLNRQTNHQIYWDPAKLISMFFTDYFQWVTLENWLAPTQSHFHLWMKCLNGFKPFTM